MHKHVTTLCNYKTSSSIASTKCFNCHTRDKTKTSRQDRSAQETNLRALTSLHTKYVYTSLYIHTKHAAHSIAAENLQARPRQLFSAQAHLAHIPNRSLTIRATLGLLHVNNVPSNFPSLIKNVFSDWTKGKTFLPLISICCYTYTYIYNKYLLCIKAIIRLFFLTLALEITAHMREWDTTRW